MTAPIPAAGYPEAPAPATPETYWVSASQVKTWRECKRKWAWAKIAGIQQPDTTSTLRGKAVHAQLEQYLKTGDEFDYSAPYEAGYLAGALRAYAPAPGTHGLTVERRFQMPSPTPGATWGYLGFIDVSLDDAMHIVPPLPAGAEGNPAVQDWKTTSSLADYAMRPDEMPHDPQAIIYAVEAMHRTGRRTVDLCWVYVQTKGAKKSRRSHYRATAAEILPAFLAIDADAKAIAEAFRTVKDPLALDATPEACDNYGGCPYRAQCALSPEVLAHRANPNIDPTTLTQGVPDVSTSALFAKLAAKRGGAPAPAAAPAVEAPPAPLPHVGVTLLATPTTAPAAALPGPGINPPEVALESAPVGVPEVVAAAPAPAPAPAAKRAPGRPRKAPEAAPLGKTAGRIEEDGTEVVTDPAPSNLDAAVAGLDAGALALVADGLSLIAAGLRRAAGGAK